MAEACNFIKNEALAQAFSCDFCEISINIFVHRKPVHTDTVLTIIAVTFNKVVMVKLD